MILFGDKLKKLRIESGLTQEALAKTLGLATSAISSYESCTRRPSYEVLVQYANIFHVSTDYLLGSDSQDLVDLSDLNPNEKEAVFQVISVFRNMR